MTKYLVIILSFCFGLAKSQGLTVDTLSPACQCIDGFFSSSTKNPIAISIQDGRPLAFCGYTSEGSTYKSGYGILKPDSSALLCGFELIDFETGSSIFNEGEYYTDSVKLGTDGFELFRLTNLPSLDGGRYISVPAIQFLFYRQGGAYITDTLFAIPGFYFAEEYLSQIEKNLNTLKADKSKEMEAKDLEFNFLFLRALSSEKHHQEFYDSAPRDGYFGPIFRDYMFYLDLKLRTTTNKK